jgi:hypothetical protein
MESLRCGAQALVVSVLVVALYRALAPAIVAAGVPPTLLVLTVAAGMATFGARLSRRWASPRPECWALFAAALGVYALPVLLFQAARAQSTLPTTR